MNEDKKRKIAKIVVVIILVGIPVLVMFYNTAVGGLLLVSGMYSTYHAMRWIGNPHLQFDKAHQFHNRNAAGKTILVQVVDDFGRELPPGEVARRLAEARTKAGPRDTIIEANFKVESGPEKSKTNQHHRD